MLLKDSLNSFLSGLASNTPVYVAYSGGLDSHVLLHLVSQYGNAYSASLHSIHVNHNFSPSSGDWANHCASVAGSLGFEHRALEIIEKPGAGESLEAWAREKRYRLMASKMPENAVLLTAHHLDDQAETLLLQMLRGGGASGLAAMPILNKRYGVLHGRPLLGFSREEIAEYARSQELCWIEDESNVDTTFDRNFLRHEIFPLLRQRWPALSKTLGRVAEHQAEARQVMEEMGNIDLAYVRDPATGGISIELLEKLPAARQANTVRQWIKSVDLPVPASVHLEKILDEVVKARADGEPLVTWPGCEVRRHDKYLFAMGPLSEHDCKQTIEWPLKEKCHVGGGRLVATRDKGRGIKASSIRDGSLQVRFRQGGEKICLPRQQHAKELKKLFQENSVPSWLRERIPLLYHGDELVCVADIWFAADFLSAAGEDSWSIRWEAGPDCADLLGHCYED